MTFMEELREFGEDFRAPGFVMIVGISLLVAFVFAVGSYQDRRHSQCVEQGRAWTCRHTGQVSCVTNNNVTTCSPVESCWCEQ
jgi:hypothetical protein